jgi:hypothetical protein
LSSTRKTLDIPPSLRLLADDEVASECGLQLLAERHGVVKLPPGGEWLHSRDWHHAAALVIDEEFAVSRRPARASWLT